MEDRKKIWAAIVRALNERKFTIATMESCTGGGVSDAITSISGASAVLHESYVTYCNEAKIKHGVPAEIIAKYTVYSAETALAMGKAVMKLADSDIGIGVTGQLGRIDPNNPVDKLNCVWFAVVSKCDGVALRMVKVPDDDRMVQKKFVIDEIATTLYDLICKN